MTRDELEVAVADLETIKTEYYVEPEDPCDDALRCASFCREHAMMLARVEGGTFGAGWSERDHPERCEWHGCDVALRAGGLTSHGVDSALGLTETGPLECHVYPAELVLAGDAMDPRDPRWALWEYHACKLLKLPLPQVPTHENCGGVILFNDTTVLTDHKLAKCSGCRAAWHLR